MTTKQVILIYTQNNGWAFQSRSNGYVIIITELLLQTIINNNKHILDRKSFFFLDSTLARQ